MSVYSEKIYLHFVKTDYGHYSNTTLGQKKKIQEFFTTAG